MADREQRELRFIAGAELLLNVVQMRPDGRRGDLEIVRDSLDGRTARKTDEYIKFALGEPFNRRIAGAVELGERELLRQARIDVAPAGGDGANRLEQRLRRAALREEAERALPQCAPRVHRVVVSGE